MSGMRRPASDSRHGERRAAISRRGFLGAAGLPVASAVLGPGFGLRALASPEVAEALGALNSHGEEPAAAARDEELWRAVSQAFSVDRSIINLNNGGVSPAPAIVQDATKRHMDYSHTAPAQTMWKVLEPQRETVRQRFAATFGCDPEELAFTRNASESLQICQLGMDLRSGDEVLTTTLDYPRMITAFKQRQRREGIVLRQFSLPIPAEDPQQVVQLFEQNITPRTRLILVSHVIFLNGQVLPAGEVVALGRRHGIPVIVDGAHSLANLDFKISDLNCDYFGASLHKWLFAPHGTGVLVVRRERIKDLWPLMAAEEKQDLDIRKFEEIGTHPAAPVLAIAEALTFHEGLGGARKQARLVYLRDYWARQLLADERVRLHTSLRPGLAGPIALVDIGGLDPNKLAGWLWERRRIVVAPIQHEECRGIRVSPSVYTTLAELDGICDAARQVLRDGLPA
jgi:selenocysteine lyase/cysteine desulfurase